jgi:amino acid transporter
MIAASFGSYASSTFAGGDPVWSKAFSVLILVAMTAVNVAGSQQVARVQSVVV